MMEGNGTMANLKDRIVAKNILQYQDVKAWPHWPKQGEKKHDAC